MARSASQTKSHGRSAIMTIERVGGGWYPTSMKKTSLYLEPEVDAALTRIARKHGMRSLIESGLTRALQGDTSVDEVLRVTR